MPAGRPSLYDPSYCDRIIEAGREGKSLTAFAAEIMVVRSTLNVWASEHREFSEALNVAKQLSAAWYEDQGRRIVREGGGGAQATLITFALKNLGSDDWREKQEIEHSGSVEVTSKEQRDAAVAAATRADR